MSEIYCDVCKDQEFFCPKCKLQAFHQNIKKSDDLQVPSITRITAEPYDVNTGEPQKSFVAYDLHNYICLNCNIVFGLHDSGAPTGTITS